MSAAASASFVLLDSSQVEKFLTRHASEEIEKPPVITRKDSSCSVNEVVKDTYDGKSKDQHTTNQQRLSEHQRLVEHQQRGTEEYLSFCKRRYANDANKVSRGSQQSRYGLAHAASQ